MGLCHVFGRKAIREEGHQHPEGSPTKGVIIHEVLDEADQPVWADSETKLQQIELAHHEPMETDWVNPHRRMLGVKRKLEFGQEVVSSPRGQKRLHGETYAIRLGPSQVSDSEEASEEDVPLARWKQKHVIGAASQSSSRRYFKVRVRNTPETTNYGTQKAEEAGLIMPLSYP